MSKKRIVNWNRIASKETKEDQRFLEEKKEYRCKYKECSEQELQDLKFVFEMRCFNYEHVHNLILAVAATLLTLVAIASGGTQSMAFYILGAIIIMLSVLNYIHISKLRAQYKIILTVIIELLENKDKSI